MYLTDDATVTGHILASIGRAVRRLKNDLLQSVVHVGPRYRLQQSLHLNGCHPQAVNAYMVSISETPNGVSEYSTLGGYLLEVLARDDVVGLQLLQVHDEHLVADADHRASQLAVPSRTLANGSEDERLRLPVDEGITYNTCGYSNF